MSVAEQITRIETERDNIANAIMSVDSDIVIPAGTKLALLSDYVKQMPAKVLLTPIYANYLFVNGQNLEYIDNFDLSQATKIRYMLAQNKIDANIPLERMNFVKLTDAEGLFYQCDLSEFDESRIADFHGVSGSNISYLFSEATGKSHYDLTNFRCGYIDEVTGLFQNNTDVVEIILPELGSSGWINNIDSAFEGCTSLQKIQMNPNQTVAYIKFSNGSRMFYGCSNLKDINLNILFSNKTNDISYMFYGCSNLNKDIDLSALSTIYIYNASYAFAGSGITSFKTAQGYSVAPNYVDLSYMFENCSALKYCDITNTANIKIGNIKRLFYGCTNLIGMSEDNPVIDFSGKDLSCTSGLDQMFYNCAALKEVNFTDMLINPNLAFYHMNMFYGCTSLEKVDGFTYSKSSLSLRFDTEYEDFSFINVCTNYYDKATLKVAYNATSGAKIKHFTLDGNCLALLRKDVCTLNIAQLSNINYDEFAESVGENITGYTRTIKINTNIYNSLTTEQKAALTNKGYTLTYGTS